MDFKVVRSDGSHRLDGGGPIDELANGYLSHLESRAFSPGTVRGYAFDLLNLGRFLSERGVTATDVVATDLFDYLDWQGRPKPSAGAKVVSLSARRGAAPATMNRRVAAVRGMFEYAVITGVRDDNPVPAGRRATGLCPKARGMLGHIGPRRAPTGGRLVRQPRRLPESVEPAEVAAFIADLGTHRDRAMALAMVLGGLRAAEVRSLCLADVDMGLRRVRVIGKGNRERTVPIDGAFLRRSGQLPAHRAAAGMPDSRVLRGAARPDDGRSDDRGGDAPDLPHASGQLRGYPCATPPAAAYIRDRAGHRGDRPAGAA